VPYCVDAELHYEWDSSRSTQINFQPFSYAPTASPDVILNTQRDRVTSLADQQAWLLSCLAPIWDQNIRDCLQHTAVGIVVPLSLSCGYCSQITIWLSFNCNIYV